MSNDPIVFIASIAPLQSAISIASDGGARVKIDIPESEMETVKALLAMRGRRLIMTVQVCESEENLTHDEAGTETFNRTARNPTAMARSRVQRPTD